LKEWSIIDIVKGELKREPDLKKLRADINTGKVCISRICVYVCECFFI